MPQSRIFNVGNMSFITIREIKILAKISRVTVQFLLFNYSVCLVLCNVPSIIKLTEIGTSLGCG